jgi:hypothetical protein
VATVELGSSTRSGLRCGAMTAPMAAVSPEALA